MLHNYWISPSGKMYQVGLMAHDLWAKDWLENQIGIDQLSDDLFNDVAESYTDYLHKMGWVRMMQWSYDSYPVITGNIESIHTMKFLGDRLYKMTPLQKRSIKDWCIENEIEYFKLFELEI